MEIALLIIRLILFGIFALAGVGKLLDPEGSEKAVREFGVPENLAKPLAILLPLAEIAVAFSLLFVATSWFGALAGLLLLTIFIGGMLWQMQQGNAPDCHCFGQIHSEPVSVKSLLRNALFLILSLFLVLSGKDKQGLDITNSNRGENGFMEIIFGTLVVGFLFGVIFYLKKITEQQTQILRRIEVIELLSHEGGGEIKRDDVENPSVGLPIGARVPEFELEDVTGRKVSLTDVLAKPKPTVLFFVSPSCNPCKTLLPQIEKWQEELKDRLNFVFVSNGEAKENLEKFSGEKFKTILLQKDREVAEALQAKWTPTALLVNSGGTIGGKIAAGDTEIQKLIEQIKISKSADDLIFVSPNGGGEANLGREIPEFVLSDLDGREFSSRRLIGRKTLIAYWSAGCPHCVNMLEELREWDKIKGQDEPDLILLSTGEADAYREFGLKSPIILEKDSKTAQGFGMQGTPSAVLISEKGKIVSEVAVGANNIWALLGRQPSIDPKKQK